VWPEEPGLTPAPPFFGDVTFFYTVTAPPPPGAASPGAASLGAATRGAAMRGTACAAPPAQRRLRLACA
jgi:hypothetical protein